MCRRRFKFIHDMTGDWAYANADKKIFTKWEKGRTSTRYALQELLIQNNVSDYWTEEEFVKLAHSLGYWREGFPGELKEEDEDGQKEG